MGLETVENLTQVVEIFVAANSFGAGLLGVGILLIIGFGSLFLMGTFSTRDAMISASFITMISAFFLRYLSLINDTVLIFASLTFLVALIASRTKAVGGA